MGEKETRNPETIRVSFGQPIRDEGHAFTQVFHPAGQWLQARVGHFLPGLGQLVVQEGEVHFIEVHAHDHEPFNGLDQLGQGMPNHVQERVEPVHFL